MFKRRTCLRGPITRVSIRRCQRRMSSELQATSATSIEALTAAHIQATGCSALASPPRFKGNATMITVSRHRTLVGTASLILAATGLYGCEEFLTDAAAPQGVL